MSRSVPIDQADGLRRLFAQSQLRVIPVVSNPHVAFGGLMLERVCAGFAERGLQTLVVDGSERAGAPGEMALLDLASCIEPLSAGVSYLAARGLALKFVDATGSTEGLLHALAEASPASRVMLVHAPAAELCRLFARRARNRDAGPICPLLLADDAPASVTHAYAAMKLLALRADLRVHDLLLGAAAESPRAARIATQIALCADDFLGAVLRDWVLVDPAVGIGAAPTPALRRWTAERLQLQRADVAAPDTDIADVSDLPAPRSHGSRSAAASPAFHQGH